MMQLSKPLLRGILSAMYYTGAGKLLTPVTRGRGVIFMLHSVSPEPPHAFSANRSLQVTPEFLDTVIRCTRDAGFEFAAIDEVPDRLATPKGPPFAVFTLDDGYRDNSQYAYPVFRRHGVPFTIYVPTEFAEGRGDLWWFNLEHAILRLDEFSLSIGGRAETFSCSTPAEKEAVFNRVYRWLREKRETTLRSIVADLTRRAGLDPHALGQQWLLTWDELRGLAKHPLVTVGTHTRSHFALSPLSAAAAREEVSAGRRILEQKLDRECRHFSFPYGDALSCGPRDFDIVKDLGFTTAVTTRKGLLQHRHVDDLLALPRLSLNGDFQRSRYVEVLLSGAPFALNDAAARWLSRPQAGVAAP